MSRARTVSGPVELASEIFKEKRTINFSEIPIKQYRKAPELCLGHVSTSNFKHATQLRCFPMSLQFLCDASSRSSQGSAEMPTSPPPVCIYIYIYIMYHVVKFWKLGYVHMHVTWKNHISDMLDVTHGFRDVIHNIEYTQFVCLFTMSYPVTKSWCRLCNTYYLTTKNNRMHKLEHNICIFVYVCMYVCMCIYICEFHTYYIYIYIIHSSNIILYKSIVRVFSLFRALSQDSLYTKQKQGRLSRAQACPKPWTLNLRPCTIN